MLVAHLPAGFLLTKFVEKRTGEKPPLWLGLLGSVLPDIDLIYFYLIDHQQHPHHTYWTHVPLFWLAFSLPFLAAALCRSRWKHKARWILWLLIPNILLHLVQDSFVGGIYWLYPFSPTCLSLFRITPAYANWVFNFVFHWTFMFEVLFCVAALFVVMLGWQRESNRPAFSHWAWPDVGREIRRGGP